VSFRIAFLFGVALQKEIKKKNKKENTVATDPPGKYQWEVAFNKEQLKRVDENSKKLSL